MATYPAVLPDTDVDGVDDDIDLDDDNDGITDNQEGFGESNGQFSAADFKTFRTDGIFGFATQDSSLNGNEFVVGSNASNSQDTPLLATGDLIVYSMNGGADLVAITFTDVPAGSELNAEFKTAGTAPKLEFRGVGSKGSDEERLKLNIRFFDPNDADFLTAADLGEVATRIASGQGTAVPATTSVLVGDIDDETNRLEGVGANLNSLASYTLEDGGSFNPVIEGDYVRMRGTVIDPDDDIQFNFLQADSVDLELLNDSSSRAGYGLNFKQGSFTNALTTAPTGIDSDGDGIKDHLDLDSDGDGIPDNVEAQATDNYVAPAGDAGPANDGLDSAYGSGLTPQDTDSDSIPDYLDSNSDNDGAYDIVEAGISLAGADADSDGLDDSVDATPTSGYSDPGGTIDDPLAGPVTLPDEDSDAGNSLLENVDFRDVVDTDGDGVADATDLDDDNDGILDSDEGLNVAIPNNPSFESPDGPQPGTFIQTDASAVPFWSTDATDNLIEIWSSGFNGVPAYEGDYFAELNARQVASLFQDIEIAPGTTVEWSVAHRGRNGVDTATVSIGDPGSGLSVVETMTTDNTDWVVYTGTYTVPLGQTTTRFSFDSVAAAGGKLGSGNFIDAFTLTSLGVDSDGDGIADHLDIDSDNDGITDNVEAQATADYIAPSGTGSNITDVNNDGLDDNYDAGVIAGGTPTGVGLAPVDSDGDSIADRLDADSDNDGVTDQAESGLAAATTTTDSDNDGLLDDYEGTDVTDGFDVNDENLDVSGNFTLADTDNDTAADGSNAVPTGIDIDYRDDNIAPNAVDDGPITVTAGVVNNVAVVAPNDTDPDGDSLSITEIIDPATGTPTAITVGSPVTLASGTVIDLLADGTLNITPVVGGTANETFDYTISDGSETDTATVTLDPNTAPVAVDDGPVVVAPGAVNNIPVVAPNDTDLDGDALTITEIIDPATPGTPMAISVGSPVTLASGTVVALLADGTLDVTPLAGATANETFDYTLSDGNLTDTATVTLDPNTAPNAVDDGPLVVTAGVANNIAVVAPNDTDLDGDTLTITEIIDPANPSTPLAISVGSPVTLASGTVVALLADGTLDVTPPVGTTVNETFDYTLSDGNLTDTATVTLDPNTAPDAVDDGPVVVTTGVANNIPVVVPNDTDLDGDALTITEIIDPTNPGSPLAISVGSPVTLASGTVVALLADGTLDVTPAAGATANETFDYILSDGNLTDTATVTLDPNTAPDAVDDGPVVVTAGTANNVAVVAPNDTDLDGDALTITEIIDPATGTPTAISVGSPVTLASGTVIELLADGTLDITPPVGATANETFDYTLSDGNLTDTATVTLNPNTAPDAVDDGPVVVTAGAPNNIAAIAPNDTDLDGDVLTITEIIDPANPGTPLAISVGSSVTLASGTVVALLADGTLDVTPAAGATANETFDYTLSDGNLTDTATVSLDPNTAPDAVDDGPLVVTAGAANNVAVVAPNDTDLDGDVLTITEIIDPANPGTHLAIAVGSPVTLASGTIVELLADGTLDITPPVGVTTPETFDYTLSDGNLTDRATVSLDPNTAPDAVDDGPLVVTAGTVNNIAVVAPNDTDLDGDALTITEIIDPTSPGTPLAIAVGSPVTLASGTVVALLADGTLDITPPVGVTTPETFDYTLSDGNLTDQATVSLDPNTAPDAVDDGPLVVTAGTANNIAVVAPNDTDLDGDALIITEIIDPTNPGSPLAISVGSPVTLASGTVVALLADGTLDVTIVVGATVNETFDYTLSDGNLTDTATVSLDPNTAPDAVDDGPVVVTAGTANNVAVVAPNDTDLDGDALTITEIIDPATGTPTAISVGSPVTLASGTVIELLGDGTLNVTPLAGATANETFDYTISDGNLTDTATVTLDPNTAPDAVDDGPVLVTAGATNNIAVIAPNDTDLDGDALTITEIIDPTNPGTPLAIAPGSPVTLASGTVVELLADGTLDVTPPAGASAPESFSYTLSDGNLTDTAIVTIAPDADGDGVADVNDIDDDNDGILDTDEEQGDPNRDTDGDGIVDRLDLDSDNDGLTDIVESGLTPAEIAALDTDGDGQIDPAQTFGPNGFADPVETAAESGTPNYGSPVDTDGDLVPDFQDLDADNDGINDVIEGGGTDADGDGLIDGAGTDADGDGLADAVDPTGSTGTPLPVPDTDTDGAQDFRDLDSDNDGLPDLVEAGLDPFTVDTNNDGVVDGPDSDGDGIQDPVDGTPTGPNSFGDGNGPSSTTIPDADTDGTPDYLEVDSDGDGTPDRVEEGLPQGPTSPDANGDGVVDSPADADGDGSADGIDPLPGTFGGFEDTDGDGVPDYKDLDDDNDGILDTVELATAPPNGDTDGDGIIDSLDLDADNDGILDIVEAGHGQPDANGDGMVDGPVGENGYLDAIETNDTGTAAATYSPLNSDSDGQPNFQDLDSDNDSLSDLLEGGSGGADANDDGVVDGPDTDGDGLQDSVDGSSGFGDSGSPVTPNNDTDANPDYIDVDSNDDGLNDIAEAGNLPLDSNGDGVIDAPADADNDGILDVIDDSDLDGTTDPTDPDPQAFGGLGAPDTDGDGILDSEDLDDDNDGILDTVEENGDPARDTDGDGILDRIDLDADNDGINDVVEAMHGLPDANGDGMVDGAPADFGPNGFLDALETAPESGTPVYTPANNDNDDNPDFQDLDSDNDSLSDLYEGGSNGADANGDGVVDGPDSDGDGLQDSVDAAPATFGDGSSPVTPNSDGDTNPDYIDIDSDGDGIDDIDEASNGPLDANNDGMIDDVTDGDDDGIPDVIDDSDVDGTPDADPAETDPQAFGGLPLIDTDSDGIPDIEDLDDDNDGILDTVEENGDPDRDTDGDGVLDRLDLDADNDGINDVVEAMHGQPDANGDGMIDGPVGSNGYLDAIEDVDTPDAIATYTPANNDNDDNPDFQDLDSDNDSLSDLIEGGSGGTDANNDGVVDGPDADGDGIQDSVDGTPAGFGDSSSPVTPDADSATDPGTPDYIDVDSNDDGVNDIIEAGEGVLDLNGDGVIDDTTDVDDDGIPDVIDDSDADGAPDITDPDAPTFGGTPGPAPDADGDGIPNDIDLDDDNDGILDTVEEATAPANGDTDGDGIPDRLDLDADNDGINDVVEAGHSGVDTDGDGMLDSPVGTDGVPDEVQASPNGGTVNYTPANNDLDGQPDFQDLDSDNDSLSDLEEGGSGGADNNGDGVVDGPDTDGDGLQDSVDGNPLGYGDTTSPVTPDADSAVNPDTPDYIDVDSDNNGVDDIDQAGNTILDPNDDGMIDDVTDLDNDGIPDVIDDSDQDGIPDADPAETDPQAFGGLGNADTDGDGILNVDDLDDDNDGILDTVEQNGDPDRDTDGDGILDRLDLDADNDGINDVVEAGHGLPDADGDGMVDGTTADFGPNGFLNALETAPESGTPIYTPVNNDNDDNPDFQDLDSDNDSLSDLYEGGSNGADANGDGVVDGPDSDGDGLQDSVDGNPTEYGDGSSPVTPNSDGDANPDYIDIDSDGDGIDDIDEASNGPLDADNDGMIDDVTDIDDDGVPDVFDDSDLDGTPDADPAETDPQAFGGLPLVDTDSDGIPDIEDLDDDNDGILDTVEENGDSDRDTDGDGILDRLDLDADNDGINDVVEAMHGQPDADGDGMIDGPVGDNGYLDSIEDVDTPAAVATYTPANNDNDNNPDFQDLDSDNDSLSDLEEGGSNGADANNDGVVDGPDSDGDGIQDSVDGNPATFGDTGSPVTPDADSATDPDTPDYIDVDSNDDGLPDIIEAGNAVLDPSGDGMIDDTTDVDNDGIPDVIDDSDADGIPDITDPDAPTFGGLAGPAPDADGDGIPNDVDLDDDNDGILDTVEEATAPANGDTDGDGIPDRLDLDSDNDGINDVIEAGHGQPDSDGDGMLDGPVGDNGVDDVLEGTPDSGNVPAPVNSDSDGQPDFQDLDSDNDGLSDFLEGGALDAGGVDADDNGVIDGPDSDGDGIQDSVDGTPNGYGDSGSPATPNEDGDAEPDYIDIDSDGDGTNDADPNLDVDGDGEIDDVTDLDNDGIVDVIDDSDGDTITDADPAETDPQNFGGLPATDTDEDGIPDSQDLDDDNDGILDTEEGDSELDTDSDGVPDSLDPDSDNDGILDVEEAGHGAADTDGDGQIDGPTGSNGLPDVVETSPESGVPSTPPIDTDGDGVEDFQDLDSDNDGINDVLESGGIDPDGDGIVGTGTPIDADEDGLIDAIDPSEGGTPTPDVDTDGDGVEDYQDLDSDNDGLNDVIEAGNPDSDGDGVVDGPDSDGDGIADIVDPAPGFGDSGSSPADLPDTDGDGVTDNLDLDSDNDGINDVIEAGNPDSNGDGLVDGPDSDGDGIADSVDPATGFGDSGNPNAPDTDGDGVTDNLDLDSDNDGINDVIEGGNLASDANGDGLVDGPDTDGDGIQDSVDPATGFGDVGTAIPDTDGDGTPDALDLDSDNDGIDDIVETGNADLDANGDGIVDGPDTDGDGVIDAVDPADGFGDVSGNPLSGSGDAGTGGLPDTNGDGIPDYQQPGSSNLSDGQGSGGSDVLTGGIGADIINGLSDNDLLDGGAGNDIINGGSDADGAIGGTGNDIINAGSDGDDVSTGEGNDIANGGSGDDTVSGGSGDDIANGGSGLDTILGGDGNDILNGGSGDDQVLGGNGTDILRGSSGNDMLVGGNDADLLFGGQGNDTFAYTNASEFGDTIMDFEIVRDRIDLSAIFNGNATLGVNVQAQQMGLHTVLMADAGAGMQQVAMLLNVKASTLDSNNFIF